LRFVSDFGFRDSDFPTYLNVIVPSRVTWNGCRLIRVWPGHLSMYQVLAAHRHFGRVRDRQADEPRELTFVPEHAIWAEADALLDADALAHGARRGSPDPVDNWYRQPAEDEPRELTFVDEDTFWAEF